MPFAAFFGAAIGAFLFGLLQWFGMKLHGGFSEDGWMYRYILPVFAAGAFGWLYAWISCAVAPRGKVVAGTVMATILVVLGVVNIALAWLLPRYSVGEATQITVGMVASSVAAVVALVQAHGEREA
jgi:uncharacterized membrane-anchored protein